MLSRITSIFTTAAPSGVAIRDLITGFGAVLAMLGVLGFLTEEQVAELTKQAPALLTGLGTALYAAMTIYRSLTKSSSDKAAEAARQIDAKVAKDDQVVIRTPKGTPTIVVQPKGR